MEVHSAVVVVFLSIVGVSVRFHVADLPQLTSIRTGKNAFSFGSSSSSSLTMRSNDEAGGVKE